MKRILVTGANSYIGTSFEKYVAQWPDQYRVDTVDMIGDGWRSFSFSGYDVVFHVAGVVHKGETKDNSHVFFEINRDLAVEAAKKAKTEGVKQFIFLSSISVYGMTSGNIDKETKPIPVNSYGLSKLQAEIELGKIADASFVVTIVRPPMVYGKGCKGNYQVLRGFILKYRVFPAYQNNRSAIYIENLLIFVKHYIDNTYVGTMFPQDDDFFCTSNIARLISQVHACKIFLIPHLTPLIKILCIRSEHFGKVFNSLTLDKSLTGTVEPELVKTSKAIAETEGTT